MCKIYSTVQHVISLRMLHAVFMDATINSGLSHAPAVKNKQLQYQQYKSFSAKQTSEV